MCFHVFYVCVYCIINKGNGKLIIFGKKKGRNWTKLRTFYPKYRPSRGTRTPYSRVISQDLGSDFRVIVNLISWKMVFNGTRDNSITFG